MSAEQRLTEAGVYKGAEGLRKLYENQEFWDRQMYGTRLYFGELATDYLHREVLGAAIKILDEQ